RHGLAQNYFIQALRLAQAASDAPMAGTILDAMSHQATFLGRHREAADLARSARTGTRGIATPTLTAPRSPGCAANTRTANAGQLVGEAREWLRYMGPMVRKPTGLRQHKELLVRSS